MATFTKWWLYSLFVFDTLCSAGIGTPLLGCTITPKSISIFEGGLA
jgi:hypothetical protein